MQTPHFTIHSHSTLTLPKRLVKPQLTIKLFSLLRTHFWPIFHHRRRRRTISELGATDIGPAQRTPPTSSSEVIQTFFIHLVIFTFCHLLLLFQFSLLFIYINRTATKESRFLSRCSLAQARVKTLATLQLDFKLKTRQRLF